MLGKAFKKNLISKKFYQGLDKWVNDKVQAENTGDNKESSIAIILIECPKCKTQIRRSKRYIALLNNRALDIDAVILIKKK